MARGRSENEEQRSAPQAGSEARTTAVLGLIGGIGSGKTRVADELARLGARVINADAIGHEALRQPAIRDKIARRWGPGVLAPEGAVDRRALGAIVFADARERKALEELVFPWMEARFQEEIEVAQAAEDCRLVVLDAAILLEAGWNRLCDGVVYVDAPREQRLARLAQQRGWTAEEVEAREKAQMPLAEKMSRADFVVRNADAPEELSRQIEELLEKLGTEPKSS